jgi:Tfp pilus assembly protein PilF
MRLLSEVRNYMGNYHVKSGVYHYYRSEYGQAVSFLNRALADEAALGEGDRNNARRYLALSLKGLAEQLADHGDVEAAVGQLRRAVTVDPDYPDIHFLMAGMLERLEQPEEAIEAYRRAVAYHPDYLEAHVALAHCLAGSGQAAEAADVYRRGMELKVDQLQGPFRRGMLLLETGQAEAARECLREVFTGVSQRSKEYLTRALERMRAKELDKALEDLDRALELNPKYPDLHNFRGIVLCELERFDEGLAAFRNSAELCPSHLVPRLNLAFAYLRAGRQEEGEVELQAILAREPTEPVAHAKLEELRSVPPPERSRTGVRS